MEFDPFSQPDPLIDDYLAMLRRLGLTDIEIRIRELTVKAFEAHMLRKRLSVYETPPKHVQGYLYGLVAQGGSVVCLRRHWSVLREYFDFLVMRGCFTLNPVTEKTWPYWGAERTTRGKVRNPLVGMKEASLKMRPPLRGIKKPPGLER